MMKHRDGFTRIEMIVASLALSGILSVSVAAFSRLIQIWDSTRYYQLATQELSNQLERLTLLSKEECISQLQSLTISESVRNAIPSCRMEGEIVEDIDSIRVVLSFHAERAVRKQPIVLAGWLESGGHR